MDFSFDRLETYQQAMKLVGMVYDLSESFPDHEKYGLYSQVHRSVVSVASNIAESCGRTSPKEKIHFLEIAYGSLLEANCQMQIALQVGYISPSDYSMLKEQFLTTSRLLTALSKSYFNRSSLNH